MVSGHWWAGRWLWRQYWALNRPPKSGAVVGVRAGMRIRSPAEMIFFALVQHRMGPFHALTLPPLSPHRGAPVADIYAQPLKGPRPVHPGSCSDTRLEWLTLLVCFPHWNTFIGFKIDSFSRCHRWRKSCQARATWGGRVALSWEALLCGVSQHSAEGTVPAGRETPPGWATLARLAFLKRELSLFI